MPHLEPGSYERARPIFHVPGRSYHPAIAIRSVVAGDRALNVELETKDGPSSHVRLTFCSPEGIRLERAFGREPRGRITEMLTGPPPRVPLRVTETDERVVAEAGGTPVVLERRPFSIRFGTFATEPSDTSIVEWVAEPGGFVREDGRTLAYETFALGPGEQLFGLGERFHGPGLRGKRLAHWIDEPFGTNTTDRVHKSVPLVVSSRGYGLFFHHPEEAVFDLGCGSAASASVLVHDRELDVFVFGGAPKEVLRQYTAVTGRPPVPPDWSFGIWMSRCMYRNRAEVTDVVTTGERMGLGVDVVNIDPMWLIDGARMPHSCDFLWNEAEWGPLPEFAEWLHARGVRLCLWINPHVRDESPEFLPERLVEGGSAREPWFGTSGYVDLTGAGAEWWERELRRLVSSGVDAFKLDYGETLPDDVQMADGRSGGEVHNLYPLLASIIAARTGAGIHFTRAGTAGSQRYPLHWPGDSQSTWAGLRGALRGGLAAAWSGFAHWTTDVGGFHLRDLHGGGSLVQVPEDLFVRWMQFGMLCSHTRFHGMTPREPWVFGERAVEIARRLWDLRRSLRGYLLDCAREAADTGVPVLRPLALEFPDDPGVRHVDTQYLLGPGLLVCPVLQPDGEVEAYIPEGVWTDHFTGDTVEGPRWTSFDDIPLDRLPLLVREGVKPFAS